MLLALSQVLIPCSAAQLIIKGYELINSPHTQLQPPLRIGRQLDLPCPPRVKVLLAQLLVRHLVPYAATITANLDALRPVSAARVGPAVHVDAAVVDDDGLVDG